MLIVQRIGTMSQFGGLSNYADEKVYYKQIKRIYGTEVSFEKI